MAEAMAASQSADELVRLATRAARGGRESKGAGGLGERTRDRFAESDRPRDHRLAVLVLHAGQAHGVVQREVQIGQPAIRATGSFSVRPSCACSACCARPSTVAWRRAPCVGSMPRPQAVATSRRAEAASITTVAVGLPVGKPMLLTRALSRSSPSAFFVYPCGASHTSQARVIERGRRPVLLAGLSREALVRRIVIGIARFRRPAEARRAQQQRRQDSQRPVPPLMASPP